MNLREVTEITIPEGSVTSISREGECLWNAVPGLACRPFLELEVLMTTRFTYYFFQHNITIRGIAPELIRSFSFTTYREKTELTVTTTQISLVGHDPIAGYVRTSPSMMANSPTEYTFSVELIYLDRQGQERTLRIERMGPGKQSLQG